MIRIPIPRETLQADSAAIVYWLYLLESIVLTLPRALARPVYDRDLEDDETPTHTEFPGPRLVPITEASIAGLGVPFQRRLDNAARERCLPNPTRSGS